MPDLSRALASLRTALAALDEARALLPAHPRTPAALGATTALREAAVRAREALRYVEAMEREQEKRDE